MQKTFNELLLEILNIIDYPNDKNTCVKEFEELNNAEAMANMLERLPRNVQEKLKNAKYDEKEITKYIKPEEYVAEVIRVSEEAFLKLLNDITTTLSDEQKNKIQHLLEESNGEQVQTKTK